VIQYLKKENWEAREAEWAAERRIASDAFFSEREPTTDEVLAAVAVLRQHLSPSHCPDYVSDRCLAYWALQHIVTFLFHIRVGGQYYLLSNCRRHFSTWRRALRRPCCKQKSIAGPTPLGV
jgi:hypothetical protein